MSCECAWIEYAIKIPVGIILFILVFGLIFGLHHISKWPENDTNINF